MSAPDTLPMPCVAADLAREAALLAQESAQAAEDGNTWLAQRYLAAATKAAEAAAWYAQKGAA